VKILKFGGSSVRDAECIRQVMAIIQAEVSSSCCSQVSVVVSAMGGVTDSLIAAAKSAAADDVYLTLIDALYNRHVEAVSILLPPNNCSAAIDHLNEEFSALKQILQGVSLLKELSLRTLDLLMSFGERLSAYLIAQAIAPVFPSARFWDARELIKTDDHFGSARVLLEKSYALLLKQWQKEPQLPIITGFIGSTEQGETTTLGRGGSDYTAALVGAALSASEIQIWTDVSGVMTADPRKVPTAFPLPEMSYKEALEISHFGAKVIHPPTIAPALQAAIPLRIKNTFDPTAPGTYISCVPHSAGASICGISSIDDIALMRVEGSGMVGVCGIAMRLFSALAKKQINIILISQGSSEHSICFAITPQSAPSAKLAIEEEFALELQVALLDPVIVESHLAALAVVGENMRHTSGICGILFGALGRNGINVIAIAQGSSEYNISFVIAKEDVTKALNVIHEEFFLSGTTTLNLFLIGAGLIGRTLLQQIARQLPLLRKELPLDIRLVAVANSRSMAFVSDGIDPNCWKDALDSAKEPFTLHAYLQKMRESNKINSVFVDCTASQEVADHYPEILESNISIVTPNKKANSSSYATYKRLKALSQKKGVHFLYETNVGAGLPIIGTLKDLLQSGDKVLTIEGILSGTLSYIFNLLDGKQSFSALVRQASAKGFAEPDPRDDLNGMDIRRKLLILVRECGYPLELEDVLLEPLLPETCFSAPTVEAFYRELEKCDDAWMQRQQLAAADGKVLRYIAFFSEGIAKISLEAIDASHPFFHLSGSDNIIAFTTERYRDNPLVIKGQGAGAEVTAGEVFADIIRLRG
jgi:aspartokinase/homoserine dehydrogenase 1